MLADRFRDRQKMTPAFASSFLKVVTTETESNTASTATRRGAGAVASRIAPRRQGFPARSAECRASRRSSGSPDRPRRASRAASSTSAPNSNRYPGSRSSGNGRAPRSAPQGQPAAIGLKAPFEHPVRLVLLGRDETDGVFRQALGGLVHLDDRLEPVFDTVDVDLADPIDRLLHSRHSVLRSRFQGPRWIKFESLLRCYSDEITCLEPFKPCFVAYP